jgi:hypothetical protein
MPAWPGDRPEKGTEKDAMSHRMTSGHGNQKRAHEFLPNQLMNNPALHVGQPVAAAVVQSR